MADRTERTPSHPPPRARRTLRALLALAIAAPATMVLSAAVTSAPAAAAAGCTDSAVGFVVDTSLDRHPISPLIYGQNGSVTNTFWDTPEGVTFQQLMASTRPGLIRIGGNAMTAYNWENNASHHGSDYLFHNRWIDNIQDVVAGGYLPTLQAAAAAGIPIMVTVPIQDYVAADGTDTDVRETPSYLTARFRRNRPQASAALPGTSAPTTTDAYVNQDAMVAYLRAQVPSATIVYSLDNEPDLWDQTHAAIHPAPPTYDEMVQRSRDYALAIKKVDPSAKVFGPALSGYTGYVDIGYVDGVGFSADHESKGNFVDYFLQQMQTASNAAGKRLLDHLDVHWYPQVDPRIDNPGATPEQVLLREQAPRSLWDDRYRENSYIVRDVLNEPIALIPRLKAQIAAKYPGTKLAFTEWDYYGGSHISGGIAAADTLGIFGRFQVDAATLWPEEHVALRSVNPYLFGAMKAFRNYDGAGGAFRDTSVRATSTEEDARTGDPLLSSVYASVDSADPSKVVIVVINKADVARPANLEVRGLSTGTAKVYTLTSDGPDPVAAPDLTATTPNRFTYTMPAQSVSVIVPQPAPPAPRIVTTSVPAGATGVAYSTTVAATGTPAPTFAVTSGSLPSGLSLSPSTGVISGTPNTVGSSTFKVTATNTAGTATSGSLTLTIAASAPPSFTADNPPTTVPWYGSVSYAFAASGNPKPTYSVTSGTLPAGLCLDAATGLLSGTATASGTSTFTIGARNGVGGTKNGTPHTLTVAGLPPGGVVTWGDDGAKELGDGPRTSRTLPAPVRLPAGVKVAQVAGGSFGSVDHVLALTTDGKVYAWGDGSCGQLGDGADAGCGNGHVVGTPTLVAFPAGTQKIVQIAAGGRGSMALTADGDVWGWGNNSYGQFGNGTADSFSNVPVKANLGANAKHVKAIAASSYARYALTDTKNLLAWGNNDAGGLGTGSADPRTLTPTAVALGANAGHVTGIAAGGSQAAHAVATTDAGKVIGWGFNNLGQVGDGSATNRSTPVAVTLPAGVAITKVFAGQYSSFGLTATGAAYAWGVNSFGQLGIGSDPNTGGSDSVRVPTAMAPPVGASSFPPLAEIAGSDYTSIARTTTGKLYAFGSNAHGELGDGSSASRSNRMTAVSVPPGKIVSIATAGTGEPTAIAAVDSTTAPTVRAVADFDGNGRTDIGVFRAPGSWLVQGRSAISYGTGGDLQVPADYDGDGTTDVAVFRPSAGRWFVSGQPTVVFGTNGDIPVPADYSGDGKADLAVFRPSSGKWFVSGGTTLAWGANGDIPVPADYTGDGRADLAVYRPSVGKWFISGGATISWGSGSDVPVPGDYTGDGKADVAVFRRSSGQWFVQTAATVAFGAGGDVPAPGDYDGDGRTDLAVFRPSQGKWYVRNGATVSWGAAGDAPLPLPEAIRRSIR